MIRDPARKKERKETAERVCCVYVAVARMYIRNCATRLECVPAPSCAAQVRQLAQVESAPPPWACCVFQRDANLARSPRSSAVDAASHNGALYSQLPKGAYCNLVHASSALDERSNHSKKFAWSVVGASFALQRWHRNNRNARSTAPVDRSALSPHSPRVP